jgi:hypothetical protein
VATASHRQRRPDASTASTASTAPTEPVTVASGLADRDERQAASDALADSTSITADTADAIGSVTASGTSEPGDAPTPAGPSTGPTPAAAGGQLPDQARLAHLARLHFPHVHAPARHVPGLSALEKRLICWVCEHTGAPNPLHALDRLTGDPIALRRAEDAWTGAHAKVTAAVAVIRTANAALASDTDDPDARHVAAATADLLTELGELAASLDTACRCLRAIHAEAQLAEGTVIGAVNLMVGSVGGYVVEAVLTAGMLTPVVACQAEAEIAVVSAKIARIAAKLDLLYADLRRVLLAVRGFRRVDELYAAITVTTPASAAALDARRRESVPAAAGSAPAPEH